ncbi:hypothetical protein [Sphingomonas sp. G-3-2-10]|uniref:hypothetical protein n=1 Tax=Sphingomonas sp. G-3-2-10 TaxID=2728838 RepID=UPI0019CFF368|nr:hypothetical protein [Sphingomonas sp. G-3-2-10]
MQHLYDRKTMTCALVSGLDPRLHNLLSKRIAALATEYGDLTDWTEYLIVESGDTEEDIIRHIGFSPLVEPINGARFGSIGFEPHWDWLADSEGIFEMILTFGSTFAYVLLIHDTDGVPSELLTMCRRYAERARS